MTDKIKEIAEQLKYLGFRSHYSCDDNWFSCPLSPDGCANSAMGDECSCGADGHNIIVESTIADLMNALTEYESSEITRLRGIIERDVTAIRDAAESHPLFMGYGLTMEEINAEGGDASFVTDIAYKAQSILSEAEEQ